MSEKSNIPFLLKGRRQVKIITVLTCLVIASVFWIFNALNNDYSTTINYPVRFTYNKSKLVFIQPQPKKVTLGVSGYGWILLSLSLGYNVTPLELIPDQLDQHKAVSSDRLMEMLQNKLPEIKITQVLDDHLQFNYDSIVQKNIYLKPDTQKITIPQGASIIPPIKIDPAFIICSGPQSIMATLPDSISFSLPNKFIEKSFNEVVDVEYQPAPSITQQYKKVSVSFQLKK